MTVPPSADRERMIAFSAWTPRCFRWSAEGWCRIDQAAAGTLTLTRVKKPEDAGGDVPVQYVLPIDLAPQELVDHGYRDAHWLVSPDVGRARQSFRVHPSVAWKFARLELRTGNSFPVVLMDYDGPESVHRLMGAVLGADLRQPNVITSSTSGKSATLGGPAGSPILQGETRIH